MKAIYKIAFLFCVFAVTCSATKLTGYILSNQNGESTISNTGDATIYNDKDLHNLILNNFGLLDANLAKLQQSTKDMINNYGNANLLSSSLLNYVFMVESDEDTDNMNDGHKSFEVELCQNANASCFVDMIFSQSSNSIQNSIKRYISKAPKNVNLYVSGNPFSQYRDFMISLLADQAGSLGLYDGTLRQFYPLKESLQQCVEEVLGDVYEVDIENASLLAKDNVDLTGGFLFATNEHVAAFNNLMKDICAVHAISSLVVRDEKEPTVLTFYLQSYGVMESIIDESQKEHLQKILELTYEKFLNNLKSKYTNEELSGQVLLVKKSSPLASQFESEVPSLNFHQARLLQVAQPVTQTTTPTEGQQYQSLFIVPAMIVLAFILIGLFNMEVYRDTLVYAKFLAIDHHKQ